MSLHPLLSGIAFLSNYHQMITGLIPIPGSAGVSEFVFYNLFMNTDNLETGFFCVYSNGVPDGAATRTLCRSALLVWRSSTFVIPILIGGLVTAFYRSSPKNEAHMGGDLPNRQTFVSLQKETYVQRYQEVESLVETSTLSRKAVLEKLNPRKKSNKNNKKKKGKKNYPANLEKQDYDEIDLDDVEGDN